MFVYIYNVQASISKEPSYCAHCWRFRVSSSLLFGLWINRLFYSSFLWSGFRVSFVKRIRVLSSLFLNRNQGFLILFIFRVRFFFLLCGRFLGSVVVGFILPICCERNIDGGNFKERLKRGCVELTTTKRQHSHWSWTSHTIMKWGVHMRK